MSQPPPQLHELEAEVMEEVWRAGEASVREVLDALNARADKPRAYTTVMTVMNRLDFKELLKRRRQGRSDIYTARMSREEYLEARAGVEVSALVDAYGDLALVHFSRHMQSLDPKRRHELRRLARRD